MNRNQKADNRLTYVFTYLLKSYVETERRIQEEIQRMGLASVGDVTTNQSLISTIEKDFENLTAKDELPGHDYFEDHFNLALSNLSQNILPNTADMTSSNVLTPNTNLANASNQAHQPQFSFKLPDYDKENIKEDVLLRLTQHLENKISGLLKHLRDALELNNNHDLKVLRECNVELSNKLKDEFKHRDEAVQRLIKAEQEALKYFNQIQSCEDDLKNLDALRSQNEKLKRQLKQYVVDYRKLIKDKEELDKYNLLFKDNLPDLEKKLKLDLEQSKQQIELIERERDDVVSKLNRLRAEKERQEEENRRLVKEIELQKENFENEIKASQKQLDNQKKFLDTQTLERENEIDEYTARLDDLTKKLKAKEDKELTHLQQIRQLEEHIELINEEKQKLEKCYQETCNRLTSESKKNKQLQNLLDDYERTKQKTEQVEKELRERLTKLEEDLYSQLKLNETLKKNQSEQSVAIVSSFVDNVCENVEQLRCTSANQESSVLKTMSFLDQNSNHQIQETMHHHHDKHQSDSLYNSSSVVDCTFPEARQLEEKNLKLNSLVENVVRENQDLNDELKEAKNLNQDLEARIARLENEIASLKKSLEKMLLEKRILEASIDEKEGKLNELQMQLEEKRNDADHESTLKQSIESLKRKLHDEEQKVKTLNEELKKTNSKLTETQNQFYRISNEIDRVKTDKHKIESERIALQQRNKRLCDDRARLQQEIEDLQNEREDDLEDNNDIKKMFETVLQDKNEEIANLNGHLEEISQKLKECLQVSPVADGRKMNYFQLLDELISFYQKHQSSSPNSNPFRTSHRPLNRNGHFNHINNHNKQLESESYASLSPIESCEDQLTSDELNEYDDDDICSKLAGIHNNSLEICNLSFHFKNEKGLIKLINEIPEIVTNERLTKKEVYEWQINFIECFSNRNVAQLLTKNIISLRPTYLANSPSKCSNDPAKQELAKQLEVCKPRLQSETQKLRKCNANRKELIFQKKYLTKLNKEREQEELYERRKLNRKSFRRPNSNIQRFDGVGKFRVLAFTVIALHRMRTMKKQHDLNEYAEHTDLTSKIDQLNQLTIQLTDVLHPTTEKFSSFINSLHPTSSGAAAGVNKVPLNHQKHSNHLSTNHQLVNQMTNHLSNAPSHHPSDHQSRRADIKTLKELLDGLKEVYDRLVLDETLLTTSSSLSSFD